MDRALPTSLTWPPLRWVVLAGSAATMALAVLLSVRIGLTGWHDAVDAYNYWRAWDGGLYDKAWFEGAYIYSPVVAQLLWPLSLLPFEVFRALLMAASIGALVYVVGPYAAGFVALLFPGVTGDLGMGSPHLLMGAAIVAGVRGHAWAWGVLPLTKVTPGVAGMWLLRDRRQLARALAFGLGVCAVSATLAPGLWIDWFTLLIDATGRENPSPEAAVMTLPLVVRLPVAVAIAAVATWKGWAWLIPVAAWLALPVMWGASLAMLIACWPLRAHEGRFEVVVSTGRRRADRHVPA